MAPARDTIFALSSGRPPAGIGVIRISGPRALDAARELAGALPEDRRASLRAFRDPANAELLDRGLLLIAHGPGTATGEDLAELHCHGGQAVVDGLLDALTALPGLRHAEAGEFTRRALANGIIDLTEADGLADLLAAETALQRRAALERAGGATRRRVETLRLELLALSAATELAIDYIGEDEEMVPFDEGAVRAHLAAIDQLLACPPAERLRDGVRVVIAGPPNAGKSSLINALVEEERAIVTPIAGTTRDLVEVPVVLDGMPIVLIDSAGLRTTEDEVEQIGVARAEKAITDADLVLWLGSSEDAPGGAVQIAAKADLGRGPGVSVSVVTGEGLTALRSLLVDHARRLAVVDAELSITARERQKLQQWRHLVSESVGCDLEIRADHYRRARAECDAIVGLSGVDDVLSALFSKFCVGK